MQLRADTSNRAAAENLSDQGEFMRRSLMTMFAALWIVACSSQKVMELDSTGHLPGKAVATVLVSKPFDLDTRRNILLVPPHDFMKGQLQNIHYFSEIITAEELQKIIVKNGLTNKVPSISDSIGISKAATNYKPFLWFHGKSHGTGRDIYSQFILTDPLTLDDLFIVETHLDFM